jgi:hypothetical protein
MSRSRWFAIVSFVLLGFGCRSAPPTDQAPANTDTLADAGAITADAGSNCDASSGSASCPALGASGSAVFQQPIVGGAQVAVDASGNFFVSSDPGVVALDAAGRQRFAFPFGSVFALDAAGNVFVAGAFSTPLDLGGGLTLTPNGAVDTFLVELSPDGSLRLAVSLGLCGTGVESIAVARDGRIAVSGASMGTAVFDANVHLLFDAVPVGNLAFDSHDDLFVASAFRGSLDLGGGHVLSTPGDIDGFVAELDASGVTIASVQLGDTAFPTGRFDQAVTAIAINAHDELAITGTFQEEMSLFGAPLLELGQGPSGSLIGRFAATLDANLHVGFATQLDRQYTEPGLGAIAIADDGRVAISHARTAEAFEPNGHAELTMLDATGAASTPIFTLPETLVGFGLGVAFDACGNVAWAETDHMNGLVPLQPTLRLIAR